MQNSQIYIASPIKNKEINNYIAFLINKQTHFKYFLPETIHLEDSIENSNKISEICYMEIEKSNIILIIAPFGISTAAEIGYAICLKRKNNQIRLISFNPFNLELKLDTAIDSYIEKIFVNEIDLVNFINQL